MSDNNIMKKDVVLPVKMTYRKDVNSPTFHSLLSSTLAKHFLGVFKMYHTV